jgi:putative tricarboxylic transport membrane protein
LLALCWRWVWACCGRPQQIEESFIQDPLGPKAFPGLIAVLMAVSAVVMFFKPDADPHWPGLFKFLELLGTTGVMVAYAQMLPIAGFVLSTSLSLRLF